MPAATKKPSKKKKSGKKSAKKGLKGLHSIAEVLKSVRQQYELKSSEFNSYVHPEVKKLINQYAENNTLLAKVSPIRHALLDIHFITPVVMQLLQQILSS